MSKIIGKPEDAEKKTNVRSKKAEAAGKTLVTATRRPDDQPPQDPKKSK